MLYYIISYHIIAYVDTASMKPAYKPGEGGFGRTPVSICRNVLESTPLKSWILVRRLVVATGYYMILIVCYNMIWHYITCVIAHSTHFMHYVIYIYIYISRTIYSRTKSSVRNCSLAPDLVLPKPIFQRVFISGGVSVSQTPCNPAVETPPVPDFVLLGLIFPHVVYPKECCFHRHQ